VIFRASMSVADSTAIRAADVADKATGDKAST
jgi:hypothetical protein